MRRAPAAFLAVALLAAPARAAVPGFTPEDELQLRRCVDRSSLTWSPRDGTPAPLDAVGCAKLVARAVCAQRPPRRAAALDAEKSIEDALRMTPIDPASLARQPSVDLTAPDAVRAAIDILRCSEGALSGKDMVDAQALDRRASAWADAAARALAAEQRARDEVVGAVCNDDLLLEQSTAALARERANPSGVVDMRLLHKLGADIQFYRDQLAALSPAYQAARHHPFAGWRSEGACVALRQSQ